MKLEFVKINKSFSGRHILKDVSFEVQSGKAMGFLGRNGAGKTTTIRTLTDVFKPDSGKFLIDGKELDRKAVKIGYLPEESRPPANWFTRMPNASSAVTASSA